MAMLEEYSSSPDWANIPEDIVRFIADRAHKVQDRIRLTAVCQSWYTSLKGEEMAKNILPVCLMLAEKEDSNKRGFYTISEEMFTELELPEIRGRRCWGSPFGWLVALGLDLQIQLLNPLSKATLPLPSLLTFTHQQQRPAEELRNFFIYKLLLASHPTSPDSIVVAIYSEFSFLGFAKPGDQTWTPISTTIMAIRDAIYFNGILFAVRNCGKLFICEDLHSRNPKLVEFASEPPANVCDTKYLVDLGGNLCMVARSIASFQVEKKYLTGGFEMFKLDMETRGWEKILSLGGHSLFLGNCYSFSLVAAEYPGCSPNCIYFTDDKYIYYELDQTGFSDCSDEDDCYDDDEKDYVGTKGCDMGIFDCDNVVMDRDTPFDRFPQSEGVEDLLSSFSPPFWIIPYPH